MTEHRMDSDEAERLMTELRRGGSLPEDVAASLCKGRDVDALRSEIKATDSPLLLTLAKDGKRPWLRSLAVSLMRALRDQVEIRQSVFDTWNSDVDYEMRLALMWRLLDYDDLDLNTHRSIYRFVMQNWDRWLADMTMWYSQAGALASAEWRLTNKAFPASKAWVYLCLACASDDKSRIGRLLENYSQSKASIVAQVVADLRERLGQGRT